MRKTTELNMNQLSILLIIGLLNISLVSMPANAEEKTIFKQKDAHGNTIFTDQPGDPKAKRVELTETPSYSFPTPQVSYDNTPPKEAPFRYTFIGVTNPVNDSTINLASDAIMEQGTMSISARTEPALRPGHVAQLLVNGQPAAAPKASLNWSIGLPYRGTQNLQVLILDRQSQVVARSATSNFHVIRPVVRQGGR